MKKILDFCKKIIENYPDKIILPIDVAVTHEYTDSEEYKVVDINNINSDEMGLDVGSETIKLFEEAIKDASLVVWNGPLRVYEFEKYKKSTDELLKYIVDNDIKAILGGGDIVAAAGDYKDKIYHASTGGGATLEYIANKKLTAMEWLNDEDSYMQFKKRT